MNPSTAPPIRIPVVVVRIAVLAVAAVALVWLAARLDASPVLLAAARRLGATGVVALIALQAASFAADAAALRACAGRPLWRGAGVGCYLRACVIAQAVNTFTPFGQLGEVFKSRALARDLPDGRCAGVVWQHNAMMLAGTCVAVAAGLGVGAAGRSLAMSPAARVAAGGGAGVLLALAGVAMAIMGRGIGHRARWGLARFGSRSARARRMTDWVLRMETASRAQAGSPRRLASGLALTLLKRAFLVIEAVIILRALGCDRVVALGFLSQSSAQLVAWVTSFVPAQLGTSEAGGLLLFRTLGLSAQLGLSFELIRRCRRVAVATLGLAWL